MLKQTFKDQLDFEIFKNEQKVRMEKGYLTKSEREELKKMLEKEYKPIIISEKSKSINKKIITNINLLRRPCELLTKNDNIKSIVQDLKNTLQNHRGIGLSANQIGISKKISYLRIPEKYNKDKKEWEYKEIILINPIIIEKSDKFLVKGEGCISFPDIYLDTNRYAFITVVNHNETLEEQTFMSQDLEALALQHEIDHLNGITIFDRKH